MNLMLNLKVALLFLTLQIGKERLLEATNYSILCMALASSVVHPASC
jgi:hypothetical protein